MNTINVNEVTGEETANVAPAKIIKIQVGDFRGNMKLVAERFFNDLKNFGFSPRLAHKIAGDCMADLGQAMSKDVDLAAKISKAKKDTKESKFKITGTTAALAQTNAMGLVRLVQQLDSMHDEGLFAKCPNVPSLASSLHKEVQDYIARCETWVESQSWE